MPQYISKKLRILNYIVMFLSGLVVGVIFGAVLDADFKYKESKAEETVIVDSLPIVNDTTKVVAVDSVNLVEVDTLVQK